MKKAFPVVFFLLVATSVQSPVVQTQGAAPPGRTPEFVDGELIIQFRGDATLDDKANARSWVGALRRALIRRSGGGELELASIPARSVEFAIALLRRHPAVRFVEPNWILTHQTDANDSLYTTGFLWGMYGDDQPSPSGPGGTTNVFGSQAEKAWAAGRIGSRSVYVGIIDQGIDLNHPDLSANIWTNPFDPVDGVDNDGNGYVDDTHGWDFFQNNNTIFDGGPGSTVDQHGTHVAGTIAAAGNNLDGVAGVNWEVSLISGKFIGPSGGNVFWAIQALDYFTDLKTRHGLNIVATNNSWNGGGFSQALLDAIARAANAGILFVAAAGNGDIFGNPFNNDVTSRFPSNYNTESISGYDAVIAVTALTSSGDRASWANYGATTVDLAAPGNGIYSTTPNGTYSEFSGTSMATPHVTGAVALYAAMNPGATAAQIREAILASTTPTPSVDGITVTNGRLNIGNLMAAPASEPDPLVPPDGLTATAVAHDQINLTWLEHSTDPVEDGFEIDRCQSAGCTSFTQIAIVGPNVTTYANTGLTGNTTYRYRVRAFNAEGDSTDSEVADATTPSVPAPPAAPDGLVATAVAHDRINLTWADRSTTPAETAFEIDRCQGAGCTSFTQIATAGANVTSYSSMGLAASTTYRYRVRASNALGDSTDSNVAEATTPSVPAPPAAPDGLVATAVTHDRINLTWADRSTTPAETGFEIDRCQGAGCTNFTQIATVGANVTSYSSMGVAANTTYRYRVRASNAVGDSTDSNVAEATTPGAPGPPAAPDGLVATAVAHDRIDLAWADRSADPAETGFEIDRCQGSTCTSFTQVATVAANVTSYSSTGLASNTTYRYRVRASNALGGSASSNVALARTLAITSPPGAPSDLTATAGPASRQITLNWQDNATTESSFRIYRCSGTTCDSFSQIATLGANVTTFVDTDRTSGRTYRYRVRANNSKGNSSYTNTASATAP